MKDGYSEKIYLKSKKHKKMLKYAKKMEKTYGDLKISDLIKDINKEKENDENHENSKDDDENHEILKDDYKKDENLNDKILNNSNAGNE